MKHYLLDRRESPVIVGKHFIVTGGTSGLGLEITKELLKRGAYVTLIVRSTKKFENINFDLYKKRVSMLKCNLQDTLEVGHISKSLCYPIDGIVYSAGLGFFKSIQSHSLEEMIETYHVNVLGFIALFKTVKPYLTSNASIVGISSQSAFVTQANAAFYGSSKAALNSVLNALRIEEQNLHVMAVNPGPINTPFHKKADPSLKYANKYASMMIDPKILAKEIVRGIITRKVEINKPVWMNPLLKLYQLAPRKIETYFTSLFKNKV